MSLKHVLPLWSPRILGIAVTLFIGLFALDAFTPGKPFGRSLADFAIHLLPAIGILAIVALAWSRPRMGGIAFILIAAAYALAVNFRPDWVVAISGPLLLVGVLFLWSWRSQLQGHAG